MDWSSWKPATCLPDCWCEAARIGSWILEPVNTWTNLVFVLAGIYFFANARSFVTHTNAMTSLPIFPKLYGFALVFVGLGSFFYHASQTFVGQWFDVFGMYLVSMFYIAYNFYRTKFLNKTGFLALYFGTCVLLGFAIYYLPETRRWLFGASIVFTFIQTVWIQKRLKSEVQTRYLAGAVIAYGVAQTVWVLDKNRIWCDPYAWMNGHGIWHMLTGLAAVLAYFYFASEKPRPQMS